MGGEATLSRGDVRLAGCGLPPNLSPCFVLTWILGFCYAESRFRAYRSRIAGPAVVLLIVYLMYTYLFVVPEYCPIYQYYVVQYQ